MEKNPFSLFDFFGYVFPGAFALFVFLYFAEAMTLNDDSLVSLECLTLVCSQTFTYVEDGNALVITSIFMLLSYIVGHIIAYLSSLTIERFVIWWYGYPSEFLLKRVGKWHVLHEGRCILKEKKHYYGVALIRTYLLRFFVGILLLPISIPTLFIKLLGCENFFTKTLDDYLIDSIMFKRKKMAEHLNLPDSTSYENVDYHRVIYHYVYENSENHRQKLDNYVALYDFLRSMTLIFDGIFVFLVIYGIVKAVSMESFGCLDWTCLLVLLCVTYLFYMSFFKFYRRFTLEAFMGLVSSTKI